MPEPQLIDDARKSLSRLYQTCVPLNFILSQRRQPEVPVERLAVQAHKAGINLVRQVLDAEGTQRVSAVPEDVPGLLALEYECVSPGCDDPAVRGHNDFLHCGGHENRCAVLSCGNLVQEGILCTEHSGEAASRHSLDLMEVSHGVPGPPERLAASRSGSRAGKRHRCLELGCDKWQNWRYRQYCAKHGRERGLEPIRKSCHEPGCPNQRQTSCSGYCMKHARQRGIPSPARCMRGDCRRVPRINGLCEVCANGGLPSGFKPCIEPGCSERGTHKRHWLCLMHFERSKLKAVGQPCISEGCELMRNVGYGKFCTKHGQENGLLLKRMVCRSDDCDHRAILASVGYCAKHARKLGIRIPNYHCAEPQCLRTALTYGGYCRKHRLVA